MVKDVFFDLNWKKIFSQAQWVNAALKDNLQINGQKSNGWNEVLTKSMLVYKNKLVLVLLAILLFLTYFTLK